MTRPYAQHRDEPYGTRLSIGRAPRAKEPRTRHERAAAYILSRMRWNGASELAMSVMNNELSRWEYSCNKRRRS